MHRNITATPRFDSQEGNFLYSQRFLNSGRRRGTDAKIIIYFSERIRAGKRRKFLPRAQMSFHTYQHFSSLTQVRRNSLLAGVTDSCRQAPCTICFLMLILISRRWLMLLRSFHRRWLQIFFLWANKYEKIILSGECGQVRLVLVKCAYRRVKQCRSRSCPWAASLRKNSS